MLASLCLFSILGTARGFVASSLVLQTPDKTLAVPAGGAAPILQAITDTTAIFKFDMQGSLLLSDAGDFIRNIAGIVFGIGAFLALFVVLFSTVIIPQAAEQLESQVRSQYPDLWKEYASQLNEGETLVMRPDLMQSLGERVQKLAMADFENQQAAQGGGASSEDQEPKMDVFEDIGVNTRPPIRSPSVPNKGIPDAIDADIIEDK